MTDSVKANDPTLVDNVASYARQIRASLARIEDLMRNAEAFRRRDFLDDMRGAVIALDNAEARALQMAVCRVSKT